MKRLLALGFVAGCHAVAARPEGSAGDEVRAARARSNAAIAARDLATLATTMLADVVVTTGNGNLRTGRDSTLASFAQQFADPAFLGYLRTPTRVEISGVRPLAAEQGEWVGRWRRADGVQVMRGTYLAMWRRTDDGWRLRSELFVSLTCTGSTACAQ